MKIKPVHFTKNGVSQKSKKLYAHFYDHMGVRRRLPLFTDQKNSVEAARCVERLISVRASNDMIPLDLARFIENTLPSIRKKLADWRIVDIGVIAAVRTLPEHLLDWKASLLADESESEYVELIYNRAAKLLTACKCRVWNDIQSEPIKQKLKTWRDRAEKPMSVQTSNFYLQAVKQFCKWMVEIARRATSSPLAVLKRLDVATDRRHDRRAYSLEEFEYLLAYLLDAPAVMGISATERSLIYRFAAETGLRSGAITRFTKSSFGMSEGKPAVGVPKGKQNKYKTARWVPLRESLWELVEKHIAGKAPGDRAFKMPKRGHGSKMIRTDLREARTRWIGESQSVEEKKHPEESNFLRYCDDQGRYLDFHAFRHTRGVWLFEHHNAKPREVQELLGLGSLALVDRYTKSFKMTDRSVIERGRDLKASAPPVVASVHEISPDVIAKITPETPKSLAHSLPQIAGFERQMANSCELKKWLEHQTVLMMKPLKFREKAAVLTEWLRSDKVSFPLGEVAERLNAPVSKTG